jgi:hypothetical protein
MSDAMTPEKAKRLLQAHSGRDMETDPAKWENGFLVPLRAEPDDANEGNFLEVMECIRVLAPAIAAAPAVDRELMAALWGLIFLPRVWAFNPNQLAELIHKGHRKLDGDRLSRLADQLDRIAEAVDYALNGAPESVGDAMNGYGEPLPNYFAAIKKHAEPGSAGSASER